MEKIQYDLPIIQQIHAELTNYQSVKLPSMTIARILELKDRFRRYVELAKTQLTTLPTITDADKKRILDQITCKITTIVRAAQNQYNKEVEEQNSQKMAIVLQQAKIAGSYIRPSNKALATSRQPVSRKSMLQGYPRAPRMEDLGLGRLPTPLIPHPLSHCSQLP